MSDVGVTIDAAHISVNMSPHLFLKWAQHYYKARLDFDSPEPFSPVPYFLLCRAIELSLKSRLLEGQRQKDVKDDYGHRLHDAYVALPQEAKCLSENEVALLAAASAVYAGKGFEYPAVADALSKFGRFPDLDALDSLARKMVCYGG